MKYFNKNKDFYERNEEWMKKGNNGKEQLLDKAS
jgi:hypothetical protein